MRIVVIPRVSSGSFAVLWLTARKRPGKICRQAAVSPCGGEHRQCAHQEIIQRFQLIAPVKRRGMALA
jgi:hypothetical protein